MSGGFIDDESNALITTSVFEPMIYVLRKCWREDLKKWKDPCGCEIAGQWREKLAHDGICFIKMTTQMCVYDTINCLLNFLL